MCDYCEYSSPLEMDREDDSYNVEFCTIINNSLLHPTIYLSASVDFGIYGCINLDNSFRINYCPICGRKLSD